ncbi:MAG: epoxyqueuosine reductase QueH [Arcobacteraceae bacterium]|nr:epoxyqueuosine reductase QueH [Arcobacteraceae bacterium]
MLVHICCSVDSHFFLQQLQKDYPYEKLIGFFYDPNIHPYSEYQLRLLDVKYSCEKLGIELLEGDWDLDNWLKTVKGLEQEPEKGDRCTVCFDKRLNVTAQKAVKLKHTSFTTTLLISPLKSQEKLKIIGENLANQYGLNFIFKDYRSGQGMHLQAKEVKENKIYRQNYCGCMYALNAQRQEQDKLCDELISPISKQILPQSIESRTELYKLRNILEDKNTDYKIIKERFLNYRLLSAKVIVEKQTIPSYFIAYSTLKSKKAQGKIEYTKNGINYLNKNEVKIVSLDTFNKLVSQNYTDVKQLIFNPLTFEDELKFRNKLFNNPYDLSCLIILDTIPKEKITIFCDSQTNIDVREKII